ncbi:MAG TPA: VOC family protein [Polyangia bacterium]|nr:VOC family protein [Polyangia bacterium]
MAKRRSAMAKAKHAVPEGYHTITPVLTLDDTAKAIDWYKKAFGAEELSRNAGPDGKIMHAEIKIGDSRIMMSDPIMDGKGPQAYGGSPAGIWIYVADCDALYNRAVAAGAKSTMSVGDQFWGDRFGAITDPFGYRWSFATRKEDLTAAEIGQRQEEFFKSAAAQGKRP